MYLPSNTSHDIFPGCKRSKLNSASVPEENPPAASDEADTGNLNTFHAFIPFLFQRCYFQTVSWSRPPQAKGARAKKENAA
jgi:hypothetical protein